MPDIPRAIAALTFDAITQHRDWRTLSGEQVPLLQRSIATELREIDAMLTTRAGTGRTRLAAIAEAIDEALLALVEE